LSSGDLEAGGWFLVGAAVAEHGPEDAPAAEGHDGLSVSFAFGSCVRSQKRLDAGLVWMLISAEVSKTRWSWRL
jgi:hypothetical protein